MPKAAAQPKPVDNPPDIERHDEVYFRHVAGPKVGRVLSRGSHGCVIEADGERHKVRWEHFLGHKVRVRPDVRVVDKGEDGFLVESASGERRFVRDPLGVVTPEPEPMKKSLLPVVLFVGEPELLLKAAGREIKNRPGLVLQDVTDKAGRQTKRWKKVGHESPVGRHNMGRGDGVKFQAGTHKGEGEVDGELGKDGFHAKDATGRRHPVHYHEVTHHAPAERPEQGGSEAQEPGAEREFYSPEEVAKLPKVTRQPYNTWDELKRHGEVGLAQFREKLGPIAQRLGLRTDVKSPADLTDEMLSSDDGFLFVAPLKGNERAKEKVEADYKGVWSELRDVVRATISVASFDQLREAVHAVDQAGLKLAQKPRDKFATPSKEGYRDLMVIVTLPNGMLAEMQFHVKPMTAAKSEGHKAYETTRSLEAKYGEEEPTDSWSDADHTAYYKALKEQRRIYAEAWAMVEKSGKKEQTPGK